MNEYGEYFSDDQPVKRKRAKMPVCTDTAGNPIARLGPGTIQRVLDRPVNVTGEGSHVFALVHCEERGVGISRHGATIRTAKFTMSSLHPHKAVTLAGAHGRDVLIRRFLKLLRSGKSYLGPEVQVMLAEYHEIHRKRRKKR